MLSPLIECVPNFSEGRRVEVIDEIVRAMLSAQVKLLGREMDANHNRAVVTIAGELRAVEEAAFRGVQRAAELIDLDQHRGAHPRIGATDVLPFVPIRDVTMDNCIEIARRVGARIAHELDIPVYLYERAATRPERRDLANIRRGEYEALKKEITTNPDRAPDFGLKHVGKAGATAVGARPFLIAFNVNLATSDLQIAKEIARATREKSGGLRTVKALGFTLADKDIVQVSMNLTDFHVTDMLSVFNHVRAEADKRSVQILGSELVGLVPLEALTELVREALQLENFGAEKIIETQLSKLTSDEF